MQNMVWPGRPVVSDLLCRGAVRKSANCAGAEPHTDKDLVWGDVCICTGSGRGRGEPQGLQLHSIPHALLPSSRCACCRVLDLQCISLREVASNIPVTRCILSLLKSLVLVSVAIQLLNFIQWQMCSCNALPCCSSSRYTKGLP